MCSPDTAKHQNRDHRVSEDKVKVKTARATAVSPTPGERGCFHSLPVRNLPTNARAHTIRAGAEFCLCAKRSLPSSSPWGCRQPRDAGLIGFLNSKASCKTVESRHRPLSTETTSGASATVQVRQPREWTLVTSVTASRLRVYPFLTSTLDLRS